MLQPRRMKFGQPSPTGILIFPAKNEEDRVKKYLMRFVKIQSSLEALQRPQMKVYIPRLCLGLLQQAKNHRVHIENSLNE